MHVHHSYLYAAGGLPEGTASNDLWMERPRGIIGQISRREKKIMCSRMINWEIVGKRVILVGEREICGRLY